MSKTDILIENLVDYSYGYCITKAIRHLRYLDINDNTEAKTITQLMRETSENWKTQFQNEEFREKLVKHLNNGTTPNTDELPEEWDGCYLPPELSFSLYDGLHSDGCANLIAEITPSLIDICDTYSS